MASALGRMFASGAKSAIVAQAKGFAMAHKNQAIKAAKNYTMQHKNQAIHMTQNYLKKKAGNLGRAANARVNSYVQKVGPQNQQKKTYQF
jgi:hypothetical protein